MENKKSVVPWALLVSAILVIVKYVFAPTMPLWIALLPLMIVGAVVLVMVAVVVIAFVFALFFD